MPGRARRIGRATACLVALFLLAGCGQRPPVLPTSMPEAPPSVGVGVASATPSVSSPVPPATPSAAPDTPTPLLPSSPLPDPATLKNALAKVPTKDLGQTGIFVADEQGNPLVSRGDKPMIPASTMKVLTALAAIDVLGADIRYTTAVVDGGNGRVVLVGGGDPLLTGDRSDSAIRPASLATLASRTAKALKAEKKKNVTLVYDATLFSGPGWNSSWKKKWKSHMPQVSALEANGGMRDAWNSEPNPAKSAAQDFAKRLGKAGIKVGGVKAGKAPVGASTLASVDSPQLSAMVSDMLLYSNNLTAETLARHLGLAASGKGTFTTGSAALTAWLKAHQLWEDGMRVDGGSGLSTKSRVGPSVLALAVSRALADPRYQAVVAGLPQAGVSGTLKDRFAKKNEAAGRKAVHAKTGTLDGVSALAGYVQTKDGATLTFAAMVNKSDGHAAAATDWLDRSAAILAGCGCQKK